MIETYREKIKESQTELRAIEIAYRTLLEVASDKQNKGKLQKQRKIFDELTVTKDYTKYSNKTYKNLKRLKPNAISHEISKMKKAISQEIKYNFDVQTTVMSGIKIGNDLKDVIDILSMKYRNRLDHIKNYEKAIDKIKNPEKYKQTESKQENNKDYTESTTTNNKAYVTTTTTYQQKLTEEELKIKREETTKQQYDRKIEYSSKTLLKGPKNASIIDRIQGKDVNIKDMEYLYGLAADILILMEADQNVIIKDKKSEEKTFVYNAYFDYVRDKKYIQQQIFKKYGVNSINQLLEKYENIRNSYYKKFSKLKFEQQEKYAFSQFKRNNIKVSLVNYGFMQPSLYEALQNEKLKFPPSKEKLISLINRRIMNGRDFTLVSPNMEEETISATPEDYESYHQRLKEYKNLTKNMTIEEIAHFYSIVKEDMFERYKFDNTEEKIERSKRQSAVMQKLFCQIIFDRKEMKYADSKQFDTEIQKIAKEYLNEDLKFSIYGHNQVSEEEKVEREEIILSEYIKYKASLKNKDGAMTLDEFKQNKYGLTDVVLTPKLEEEIKSKVK